MTDGRFVWNNDIFGVGVLVSTIHDDYQDDQDDENVPWIVFYEEVDARQVFGQEFSETIRIRFHNMWLYGHEDSRYWQVQVDTRPDDTLVVEPWED